MLASAACNCWSSSSSLARYPSLSCRSSCGVSSTSSGQAQSHPMSQWRNCYCSYPLLQQIQRLQENTSVTALQACSEAESQLVDITYIVLSLQLEQISCIDICSRTFGYCCRRAAVSAFGQQSRGGFRLLISWWWCLFKVLQAVPAGDDKFKQAMGLIPYEV